MIQLPVVKCDNSSAIIIPIELLNAIGAKQGDKLNVETKNKKLILEKEEKEEPNFEQLFESYSGEKFNSKLIEFEPIGNELW